MPRSQHKYHFIYKTTNLKNGKFYIGMHSTSNLCDGYLGSGDRLRRAIRKHGKENFKIEILEFFESRESLISKEKELVNETLLKNSMCMNIVLGGTGGILNQEHRIKVLDTLKKMSKIYASEGGKAKQKRALEDEDFKKACIQKIKNSLRGRQLRLGKKHKEESKKKIGISNSIKQKGERNSQYGKRWITNDIESRKINKEELIPIGWKLGRKM